MALALPLSVEEKRTTIDCVLPQPHKEELWLSMAARQLSTLFTYSTHLTMTVNQCVGTNAIKDDY